MGNMLPCLVQGTTLPAMNPKQRLRSLKLLVKALNKMKRRPCSQAKIASKSPSEAASVAAAGGKEEGELQVKSKASSKSAPRSRAHGRGGHKKGVVRVKVILTKEAAARLLSLTVGGQKTAAQIVAEIKRMEARRAANATAQAWRPALESIPEESS